MNALQPIVCKTVDGAIQTVPIASSFSSNSTMHPATQSPHSSICRREHTLIHVQRSRSFARSSMAIMPSNHLPGTHPCCIQLFRPSSSWNISEIHPFSDTSCSIYSPFEGFSQIGSLRRMSVPELQDRVNILSSFTPLPSSCGPQYRHLLLSLTASSSLVPMDVYCVFRKALANVPWTKQEYLRLHYKLISRYRVVTA